MGQGNHSLIVDGWGETLGRLDAVLPDGRIVAEVIAFLREGTDAVPSGELYAFEEQIYIQEKILVSNKELKGGVALYAKFGLGPQFAQGRYTGISRGGTLKVMYSAEGNWVDEFYAPGP